MAYDTDLTDAQWALVAGHLPEAKTGGRPRKTDVRRVLDGILYLVKTGCHWRLLPSDFPHWRTVYGYFSEWSSSGVLRRIQRALYFACRKRARRVKYPTIAVIDSQSVKTGKMGGERGFDGGKRVKGRKRHIAVDSLGLPLAVVITSANTHDLRGGDTLITRLRRFMRGRKLRRVYADGGYESRPFRERVKQTLGATVQIAANLAMKFKEFRPVSQRWVVERTFSWLYDFRRLVVDHERTLLHSKQMVRLAAISLMLNRLHPNPLRPLWARPP